jgi:hypothetical protein
MRVKQVMCGPRAKDELARIQRAMMDGVTNATPVVDTNSHYYTDTDWATLLILREFGV